MIVVTLVTEVIWVKKKKLKLSLTIKLHWKKVPIAYVIQDDYMVHGMVYTIYGILFGT